MMAKTKRKTHADGTHAPHELAPHLAVMLADSKYQIEAVRIAIKKAAYVLQNREPVAYDLTSPDNGIPYALGFLSGDYPEKIKSAANLLRMCLHVIERGNVTELDRLHIPQLLAAISGYDNSSKNEGVKRTRPQQELKLAAIEAKKNHPEDTFKNLLDGLEGDGWVIYWDAEEVRWKDSEGKPHITRTKTFQDWLANLS